MVIGVQTFTDEIQLINPLQEGEFIIVKDDPNAHDWYCAEIRKVLADRIEVNYYTTITPPLERYTESNPGQKWGDSKTQRFLGHGAWTEEQACQPPLHRLQFMVDSITYGGEESHWKT
jgi:hypothetical protein